jgi:DNA-binding NarL/FixJ family response regulator
MKHKKKKEDVKKTVIEKKELTSTEKKIIALHMQGKDRKEVARELTIEVSTYDAHIRSIHLKTGTNNMAGVIKYGHDNNTGKK